MAQTAVDLTAFARKHGQNPATLAVAWAAAHPAVTAPIISARDAAQLQASLDAMDVTLSPDDYAKISSLAHTPAPATDRLEEA